MVQSKHRWEISFRLAFATIRGVGVYAHTPFYFFSRKHLRNLLNQSETAANAVLEARRDFASIGGD